MPLRRGRSIQSTIREKERKEYLVDLFLLFLRSTLASMASSTPICKHSPAQPSPAQPSPPYGQSHGQSRGPTGNLTGNPTGNPAGKPTGIPTGNVTGNPTGNSAGNPSALPLRAERVCS